VTASKAERNQPVSVAGVTVPPGRRRTLEIPAGRLVTGTQLGIPTAVVNGTRPGPTVWLSAAIHGDELNGVEIIHRVLDRLAPRDLAGAVLAVPVVNVFGFIDGSRYLPDRRDLNRAFPGSPRGSSASRLAHLMMSEVVEGCDAGIDFHTAADQRDNLPQVRADLTEEHTRRLACAFGAPVVIDARLRDGSLREAATARGKTVLLYEGGQARRFDEHVIVAGVAGTFRVLAALGMVEDEQSAEREPVAMASTRWTRARRSGIFRLGTKLGAEVDDGDVVGEIGDSLGGRPTRVRAAATGIVIGVTRSPLVNRGDALVNIGIPEE
jgi:predicted deacylase